MMLAPCSRCACSAACSTGRVSNLLTCKLAQEMLGTPSVGVLPVEAAQPFVEIFVGPSSAMAYVGTRMCMKFCLMFSPQEPDMHDAA